MYPLQNEQYSDSTETLVATAGHEVSRAMDDQKGVDFNENREARADYAQNFGENLANYTNMALTMNGYDNMAITNNRTGNQNSALIEQNNEEFNGLNKENGDNAEFSFESVEDLFRWSLWNDTGLTPEELPKVMAESIKKDIKEGAQSVVNNGPTVLGAAALTVPHPMVKGVLNGISLGLGGAQDVNNENVNNTEGAFVGVAISSGLQ